VGCFLDGIARVTNRFFDMVDHDETVFAALGASCGALSSPMAFNKFFNAVGKF